MVAVEEVFGAGLTGVDDLEQRFDEAFFGAADRIQLRARAQAHARDVQHVAREFLNVRVAKRRFEAELRHDFAQCAAFFRRPVLDHVPSSIERGGVVVDPGPERG